MAFRGAEGVEQVFGRVSCPCSLFLSFDRAADYDSELHRLCQNMGWLYTKLVAFNSYVPDNGDPAQDVVSQPSGSSTGSRPAGAQPMIETRTHGVPDSIYDFMSMCAALSFSLKSCLYLTLLIRELYLQLKLIDVQTLLGQAQHETRRKGPFPVELYLGIVDSLQSILDRLHSMRCVTTKPEWCVGSHVVSVLFLIVSCAVSRR